MRAGRGPGAQRRRGDRRGRPPSASTLEGVEADGERVVTHLFSCLDPGYRGWRWAVTVARASRSRTVTVSETLLVPGPDAILAPPWVPWRERVRPGDLGAGDILPAAPDDERLGAHRGARGRRRGGGPDHDRLTAGEPGRVGGGRLGREPTSRSRVCAYCPRSAATRRRCAGTPASTGRGARWPTWRRGRASPAGFSSALSGPLGQVFRVSNSYAPDDGRVVSADHGCGGHSEALPQAAGQADPRPAGHR